MRKRRGAGVIPASHDILAAPDQEMVCFCAGVSKGEVLAAMDRGAETLAEVKAATGACRSGRCAELSPRGR